MSQLRSSRFPKVLGLCPTNISAIAAAANECQENLLNDPLAPDEGWWGGSATMLFTLQPVNPPNGYAYVVTPRSVARVILTDICNKPIRPRNGFYEFLEFGSGLEPKSSSCGQGTLFSQNCACPKASAIFERDNVVTQSDFPGTPQFIRIYPTNNADIGRRVLIQGLDKNGVRVLSVDAFTGRAISGEYVMLAFPFSTTVNQYSTLDGQNKEQTLGFVQFFAVDPVTGNQTMLTTMEPGETTANYRRYLVTGLPANCCNTPAGVVAMTAKVKIDFVPVQSDPDNLTIQNIPSLIEEAQAKRYSSIDSQRAAQLEQKHHRKALDLLFGQLDHFSGKVNTAITVPLFGSDRVRLNPV